MIITTNTLPDSLSNDAYDAAYKATYDAVMDALAKRHGKDADLSRFELDAVGAAIDAGKAAAAAVGLCQ